MKPRAKTEEPFDYLMKIIIIGDSGVGKSNILLRYSEGKFVENYMMTIGINYVYKVIDVEGTKIKLQIWDTAGQDKYKTITKNYYRNSQGVLIVFGVDSKDSFYSVRTPTLTQATGSRTSPKPSATARRP
jgi:small GTP-binding protein